jgi:AraC-like DNA-binding protein
MKKDVIYRCIGTDFTNGIIACGYMNKPSQEHSQFNLSIDYYSCFFVLSGNGFYHTKNNTKIPMKAGDFVQRFPGECHSTEIIPNGNWLEFFISFGRTTYDYLRSLNLICTVLPVYSLPYDNSMIQMCTRLLQLLKDVPDSQLSYVLLKAQEVVITAFHRNQNVSSKDEISISLEEACRLLSSDIDTTISLNEVAAAINMSYENFRKQFCKYIGVPPAQYRIEQRMKHAKLMLLSGTSIKETALLTGYSDSYSFTKQFTHTVGISPGRFKTSN